MDQFLALAHQHAWAPLTILGLLWLYRVLAPDSKFWLTVPPAYARWKTLVVIGLGQLICVLKAIFVSHVIWYVAVSNGFIIGFMALGGVHVLKTIWPDGSEPKWIRWIVLVFGQVVAVATVTKAIDIKVDAEGLPEAEDESSADILTHKDSQ